MKSLELYLLGRRLKLLVQTELFSRHCRISRRFIVAGDSYFGVVHMGSTPKLLFTAALYNMC